jgi:hypothetical protein
VTRSIAAGLYWLAAITITLGAYGHGFVGVKPVRAAIEASTLAPEIVRVLWIVWYFVSGCMLVFGAILFWAWPRLAAGPGGRAVAAWIIGVLYAVTGVASYLYSGGDPFWLLFVAQGVILIGTTFVLQRPAA